MSKTNQVCITCTQRDTCQYYDPNRTICVPVKVSDYGQFAGSLQPTIDWQHYRIQAAIAAMPIVADEDYSVRNEQHLIVKYAVQLADALIAELQKKGGEDGRD